MSKEELEWKFMVDLCPLTGAEDDKYQLQDEAV